LKKFIIYLIFLLPVVLSPVNAQDTEAAGSNPELRIPSEESIEKYRNDKDFFYEEMRSPKYPAWLQRIFDWFNDMISKTVNAVFSREILIALFIVLLSALIVAIVLRTQNISLKQLFGKQKVDSDEIDFITEDVNKMDFEALIAESIKTKNYRLAVRFLYLKNLKALSDKLIIKWNPNKTNYSYQYEIENSDLRSRFLDSTRIFDFVWYGEFNLDDNSFNDARHLFDDLNRSINNG